MTTLYDKKGAAHEVAHAIDVKDYLRGGGYSLTDPAKKPEMPAKSEAKPAVIPVVENKKPVVEEVIVEEVIVPKPIIKKQTRIIKK